MTDTTISSSPDRPIVTVNDLSFSYGSLRALEHVSLSVDAGQICCVLGPNGAGKSTLGATIAGALLSPAGPSSSMAMTSAMSRSIGARAEALPMRPRAARSSLR